MIMVFAGRRPWPVVAHLTKIVLPLRGDDGHASFAEVVGMRVDVVHDPVVEGTFGRVRIIDQQREALRLRGDFIEVKRRADIGAVAGVFFRHHAAVLDRGTGEFHGKSFLMLRLSVVENMSTDAHSSSARSLRQSRRSPSRVASGWSPRFRRGRRGRNRGCGRGSARSTSGRHCNSDRNWPSACAQARRIRSGAPRAPVSGSTSEEECNRSFSWILFFRRDSAWAITFQKNPPRKNCGGASCNSSWILTSEPGAPFKTAGESSVLAGKFLDLPVHERAPDEVLEILVFALSGHQAGDAKARHAAEAQRRRACPAHLYVKPLRVLAEAD